MEDDLDAALPGLPALAAGCPRLNSLRLVYGLDSTTDFSHVMAEELLAPLIQLQHLKEVGGEEGLTPVPVM